MKKIHPFFLTLFLLSFISLTIIFVVRYKYGPENPVSNGKIVEKYHTDATTRVIPTVTPTGGGRVMVTPKRIDVPERWVFVLEDCSKSCRKGEVHVNKEVYNDLEVGDQYP